MESHCAVCNKKVNRREQYSCLSLHQEEFDGKEIKVIKSKELKLFCSEKCLNNYFKRHPN